MRCQPRKMSLTACIRRWPATTRSPSLVNVLAPAQALSTDGWASLTCRNSGSVSSRPSISTIQHRVPTLPTPTTLRAMSANSNSLSDQLPPKRIGAAHYACQLPDGRPHAHRGGKHYGITEDLTTGRPVNFRMARYSGALDWPGCKEGRSAADYGPALYVVPVLSKPR